MPFPGKLISGFLGKSFGIGSECRCPGGKAVDAVHVEEAFLSYEAGVSFPEGRGIRLEPVVEKVVCAYGQEERVGVPDA